MKLYGIAYTQDGSRTGKIVSWKTNSNEEDVIYEDRDLALEACDKDGWTGYVFKYEGKQMSEKSFSKQELDILSFVLSEWNVHHLADVLSLDVKVIVELRNKLGIKDLKEL